MVYSSCFTSDAFLNNHFRLQCSPKSNRSEKEIRRLIIVAGLTLKSLRPRVWDPESPYYLPDLQAFMISYADFHAMPAQRRRAMEQGLHKLLGIPEDRSIYLDNGAFYFLSRGGEIPQQQYEEFVRKTQPQWRPIPQDFIPVPTMTRDEQYRCFERTMQVNQAYQHDGYVPVIHISQFLEQYCIAIQRDDRLAAKPAIALGGIVPNLLRVPKAMTHSNILNSLQHVRATFADKQIHVFGIGGTATLHLAALLGMDSIDSSGWRNRAARGMVQLPGSGERVIAELGSWRGRRPSSEEWERLRACPCPACQHYGLEGLQASGVEGFSNRAAHNLWVLLNEAKLIQTHLTAGTYKQWYKQHLDNTIYRPLIDRLAEGLPEAPPSLA
jgi:queuine/archaeosine tRNA-ribosyltransferase